MAHIEPYLAEDGPEEGTVSKVDGDRLKSYGGPENQVRLD